MSYQRARRALSDAMKASSNKVIALHGSWGTGKTHLWHDVAGEFGANPPLNTIYVSCSAYESLAAIKASVITMTLSRTSWLAKYGDRVFGMAVGVANSKLPEGLKLNASLTDIQGLLPTFKRLLPRNTFVVLDDIERAEDFDVWELLGFVAFLVDQLELRVILITNKEKMREPRRKAWEALREKIISIEISVAPTPTESVQIGLASIEPGMREALAERIAFLGINNIRVIRQVRRVYEAIETSGSVGQGEIGQLVPSIVLLVALHFGAVEHAPPLDESLRDLQFLEVDKKGTTDDERKARRLLAEYRLGVPDAFENEILRPFLELGYLDHERLAVYSKQLELRRRRRKATMRLHDFIESVYWDASLNQSQLNSALQHLLEDTSLWDATQISILCGVADNEGLALSGDILVEKWLAEHASEFSSLVLDEHHFDAMLRSRHPKIVARLKKEHEVRFAPLSLSESVAFLNHNDGWGPRQSDPVVNATEAQIESLLRNGSAKDRSELVILFGRNLSGQWNYEPLSAAARNFVQVCRRIIGTEPESRLALILRKTAHDLQFEPALSRAESETDCEAPGSR